MRKYISCLLVTYSHVLNQSYIVQEISIFGDIMTDVFNTFFKSSHLSNQNRTPYFWNTLHKHSIYTSIALNLLHNSKISLIIVMLTEIIFLSPIKISFISVTVTFSLIRVPILRRVSINRIYRLSLKFLS